MHKSIFIGLFALSPFLFSFGPCQSMAQEQEEPQHMSYSCITVPKSVEFCGIPIDLTRFDRHERMDRELMAFTYMHSTSLQIIKRANRYFPVVEPILKENGIPDDFKYLMAIAMSTRLPVPEPVLPDCGSSCRERHASSDWK